MRTSHFATSGILPSGRTTLLQRILDREVAASNKIDYYQRGPRHHETMWVNVPAATREERSLVASSGVAIQEVGDTYVAGTATRSDVFALREKVSDFTLEDPQDSAALGQFPPGDEPYHDYAETVTELQAIAKLRPDFTKLVSIGKTLEGRDIWALQLNHGFDEKKPGVVFIGKHHAREHLSTEVPLMLARYLVENADKPEIKELLANRDITIIPMLNADGSEFDIAPDRPGKRARMWRKNRQTNRDGTRGVDLNRNYLTGWGGSGSSGNPSSETYRGPSPFSEPETQVVKAFMESKPNVRIALTYHTFSELILYPNAHKYDPVENENDRAVFVNMARKMAEGTGYKPQQSSALYIADGEFTDWLYHSLHIFGFTFELTPKSQAEGGFYPGPGVIQPTFEKNIGPALYLIGLADDPSRARG